MAVTLAPTYVMMIWEVTKTIEILNEYGPMTCAIPLVIGLIFYPKLGKAARITVFILGSYYIRDYFTYPMVLLKMATYPFYNAHFLFDSLLMLWLFRSFKWFSNNIFKIGQSIFIIGIILIYVISISDFQTTRLNLLAYIIYGITVLIAMMAYLYDFAFYSKLNTLKIPVDIGIAAGFILLYTIFTNQYVIINEFIDRSSKVNLFGIRNLTFIAFMIWLSFLFIYHKKPTHESN